jgi:hypothetical protein
VRELPELRKVVRCMGGWGVQQGVAPSSWKIGAGFGLVLRLGCWWCRSGAQNGDENVHMSQPVLS